jgi:hypothetical protein
MEVLIKRELLLQDSSLYMVLDNFTYLTFITALTNQGTSLLAMW